MKDELESLAKSTGRNRNTLVQEAIRRFIDAERWQIDLIEERIREADAGNFATDEEMAALYAEIVPSLECGNTMGRSYNLNGHTPVWAFDNVNSLTCNACPTSLNVRTIGGETPTIWQYNQTPGCANDLDAVTSLPT